MRSHSRYFLIFLILSAGCSRSDSQAFDEDAPLSLPAVGWNQLRILSPTLLELSLVTTKRPDPQPVDQWNFVASSGQLSLPPAAAFTVMAGTNHFAVGGLGFKRRVLYAPFKVKDLRIGNYLYLQLTSPLPQNQKIEVKTSDAKLWPASMKFAANNATNRFTPVIHVNQTGYQTGGIKKAMLGYFLGSLGEMDVRANATNFTLCEANSGREVYRGKLIARRDLGFPTPSYQQVLEADFSAFNTPGQYYLYAPNIGVSCSFFVDPGTLAAFARTYALGIYHQRCGASNDLPYTRFTHAACHLYPAEVPDAKGKFESVNESLKKESADFKENPRHTAPQLKDTASSLYPFVNPGPVDVSGGHHDAGDYSKYTINSASFIHHLMFAVDTFPGVVDLDNLGIPESGDGRSDVLQEIKWEADFLSKMQDADGGFYFLVYPRDREYEIDVTPDHGDRQVVFPKTTSVTAAAVAALAQCASSPQFRKQFPEATARYLEKAKKGWKFLDQAIAKFGKDGAYQKITHYGDEAMHDDELAWAVCELYLATGEKEYQKKLVEWLNPADPAIRKWGWWRLFDAYGCAIRSYAFAAKAGKIKRTDQDPVLLRACEDEIASAGQDQLRRAKESAYGISFPEETKRARSAGWFFSSDPAFDLATAYQLDYPVNNDPRPAIMEAILSNLNYEQGCNPVNVTYLTGLGFKRQREIVHQYAQNDRRVLPPDGIPLGNIQAGFGWIENYQKELGELCFPSDSDENAPYPFYDRWGDSFNLNQEFVILNQARGLAYLGWLMAQSSVKTQAWNSAVGQVQFSKSPEKPSARLVAPGLDLAQARTVWESGSQEPVLNSTFNFKLPRLGYQWIEAEAQFPDGRRVFAVTNISAAAFH